MAFVSSPCCSRTGTQGHRAVASKALGRQSVAQAGAAAAVAIALVAAPLSAAFAGEFDILLEPAPTSASVIDDASVINRTTKGEITNRLKRIEIETGFRVTAITVRKLEVETDAFAFADRVLEGWYPTKEQRDKKGIVLIVTSGKDGALAGGPAFVSAIGDDLIDSITGENIPIFTNEEKYNECLASSTARLEAKLTDGVDPGPPIRTASERKRTYKTKEEVEKTKGVSSVVVGTLLVIAVVVPMLQYYGYTAKE